jgi:UDP-2,3-diacylglucosamine hydrolase
MQRVIPEITDVSPEAVSAAMRATGVRTLIHGHTHRPGVHELQIDGRSARRIVLGAWYEQGSALQWDGAEFRLHSMTR